MKHLLTESLIKFCEIISSSGYHYLSDEIKEEILVAQQFADVIDEKNTLSLNYLSSSEGQLKFAIEFIHDRLTSEKKMREECDSILKKTFKLNVNTIKFSDPLQNENVSEIKLRGLSEKDIIRWDNLARKLESRILG